MNSNSIISRDGFFGEEYPFPAIFPRTPISTINELINEVESMFSPTITKKSFPYPLDIIVAYNKKTNLPEQYLINIALAGFDKDEIKVTLVQNKALKVEVMPKDEVDYSDEKYTYFPKYLTHSISKRTASYVWSLTPRIDAKNMLVNFKNGILSIALPIISVSSEDTDEIPINIGD